MQHLQVIFELDDVRSWWIHPDFGTCTLSMVDADDLFRMPLILYAVDLVMSPDPVNAVAKLKRHAFDSLLSMPEIQNEKNLQIIGNSETITNIINNFFFC